MTMRNAERMVEVSRGGASPMFQSRPSPRAGRSTTRLDELDGEIARARRDGHNLAFLVLTTQPQAAGEGTGIDYWARATPMSGESALVSVLAVGDALRADDVICYQPRKRRLVVALPKATLEGAHVALRRAKAQLGASWHLQVRGGASQLMRDAVSLDWLVAVAASRVGEPMQGEGVASPARASALRERRKQTSNASAVATGGTHGDAA